MALQVETGQPFDENSVLDAINASVLRLFGEVGASKANIRLIKCFAEQNRLFIRCSHVMLEKVRAAIAATVEINKTEAAVHVLEVSGTLKALAKKVQ